jgi:hypothetical protein
MTKVITNLNSSNHNNGNNKAVSVNRDCNGSVISNSGSRSSVNHHYDHPLKTREGAALKKSVIHAQEDGQASVQDDAPEVILTQEEMDEIREVKRMAQEDTNRVNRWRITVTVVLLITAFCVTYTTYRLLKKDEKDNFETAVSTFTDCRLMDCPWIIWGYSPNEPSLHNFSLLSLNNSLALSKTLPSTTNSFSEMDLTLWPPPLPYMPTRMPETKLGPLLHYRAFKVRPAMPSIKLTWKPSIFYPESREINGTIGSNTRMRITNNGWKKDIYCKKEIWIGWWEEKKPIIPF